MKRTVLFGFLSLFFASLVWALPPLPPASLIGPATVVKSSYSPGTYRIGYTLQNGGPIKFTYTASLTGASLTNPCNKTLLAYASCPMTVSFIVADDCSVYCHRMATLSVDYGSRVPLVSTIRINSRDANVYITNQGSSNIQADRILDGTLARNLLLPLYPTGTSPTEMVVGDQSATATPNYIGYVTNFGSNNISAYLINEYSAALTVVSGAPFAAGSQPISLAMIPDNHFLYVVNNGDNTVVGYLINPSTGVLSLMPFAPSGTGAQPVKIALSPANTFAYVANASGTVSAFSINQGTGQLTELGGSPFGVGGTPSSIALNPAGTFAYVTNANDTISIFSVNQSTGALTPIAGSPFPSGLGPKSIAFNPTGTFAYIANSTGNNVSAYLVNSTLGTLTETVGSPFSSGGINPGFVIVNPTGSYAYVANFNNNILESYTINQTTGALTSIGPETSSGSNPSSITIF